MYLCNSLIGVVKHNVYWRLRNIFVNPVVTTQKYLELNLVNGHLVLPNAASLSRRSKLETMWLCNQKIQGMREFGA